MIIDYSNIKINNSVLLMPMVQLTIWAKALNNLTINT